jgi:hypothetical protein
MNERFGGVQKQKSLHHQGVAGFSRVLIAEEVEDNGVEPMTSCMPCKRSSQLS